ncbi:MAG: hypothetical protein HY327_13740 [Chloroflexi bacterium]|nr:hypothetical protein [Chloroflexota bacterium]
MSETIDPEQITIIEGPSPEFHIVGEPWTLSILEGGAPYIIATCQVRSFNGQKLIERCERAWSNKNVIRLDFRQVDGLRRQMDIVAARLDKVDGVDVLNLWVRQKMKTLMGRIGDVGDANDLPLID